MLIAAVVVPDIFSSARFSDPAHHLNVEVMLRGVNANGLILVDAEERLYQELCDGVEPLAAIRKGKTTHALFEELLKKRRQKVVRFVKTRSSFGSAAQIVDVASGVAMECMADAIVADGQSQATLSSMVAGSLPVIALTDYIGSSIEAERRHCVESLPPLDQMPDQGFERLMIGATRFSRWLRFYDKQIGKGTGLRRFRKGIEKLLELWISNAHFPLSELSAELYTIADETSDRRHEPSAAYHRVLGDLVRPLQQRFGIPIRLVFKHESYAICHPRHLQTQSLPILFEKGFDFINDDGTYCRTLVKPDGAAVAHLQEYRRLPDYVPAISAELTLR